MCGPVQTFLINHWAVIGFGLVYFVMTCINQLPDSWEGAYPYWRDVFRSLAASKMAQRFEAKYNITTTPEGGTSKTQTVTSETPKP